jgi:MutS domain V
MGLRSSLISIAAMFVPSIKWRQEIRARWGKSGKGNAARASWYFDLHRKQLDPAAVVDDKTWSDLEFPSFFTAIDTTISPLGRQYLFDLLRVYEYRTSELHRRFRTYEILQSDPQLREDIQVALMPLAVDGVSFVADLLLGVEPANVPYRRLLVPWTLITVGGIVAAIAHLIPAWLCLLPLLVNLIIAGLLHVKLSDAVSALLYCSRLLTVADRMAALRGGDDLSDLGRLKAERPIRRALRNQIRWLRTFDGLRTSIVIGGLVGAVDALFLVKLSLYSRALARFCANRSNWVSTFESVGAVDAAIAVVSFMGRYPAHCRPTVVDDRVLDIANGYHAFIVAPVKNSIRLAGTSVLITGSNMTGKTTFIKMVAMNVILGHTLGVCLADRATLPRSPVRALIHGDQSVATGKSRYFAEAEAICGFISESTAGACRIFVLDEPFSGTNTVERIAVAKAVLRAISANAQILVTTHDVELQHLLGAQFELCYFQENPAVEGFFDHALRAGVSTRRNAIRVLERLGFPADIIAEAMAAVPAVAISQIRRDGAASTD